MDLPDLAVYKPLEYIYCKISVTPSFCVRVRSFTVLLCTTEKVSSSTLLLLLFVNVTASPFCLPQPWPRLPCGQSSQLQSGLFSASPRSMQRIKKSQDLLSRVGERDCQLQVKLSTHKTLCRLIQALLTLPTFELFSNRSFLP